MRLEVQSPSRGLVASLILTSVLAAACGAGSGGPTGAATLEWTAPAGAVAGYRVYYGIASGSYAQPLGSGTYVADTTYTVSGLPTGYRYYFAVTAVDTAGGESAYSNEASKLIP